MGAVVELDRLAGRVPSATRPDRSGIGPMFHLPSSIWWRAIADVLPAARSLPYVLASIRRFSMRRLCFGLVAALLVAQQAHAQAPLQCLAPQDRSAIEVAALRSQLMVLAMGCRADERYNAFVRKYQADLQGNERAVSDMFKRKYG